MHVSTYAYLMILALAFAARSAQTETAPLAHLSLEELLNVEVTSVSKKAENRAEAAAAIYVISNEDIRRSGATTLPDALRMVPGVHVARLDANKWSVTIRGTSGRFANKLLVLIDGRSVYTALFSGVEWEARDVLLEDVDRIEVIRGPGGTLWGANAVNGVINIVTKHARDTAGGLLELRAGSEEWASILRFGELLGDAGAYRVYGEVGGFDHSRYPDGDTADDEWQRTRLGFRADWERDEDSWTLQGDAYSVRASQRNTVYQLRVPAQELRKNDEDFWGANLLGRWSRRLDETADIEVQAYYDYSHSDGATLEEGRHTLSLQFQHRFQPIARHELVWGAEYRLQRDQIGGTFQASVDESRQTLHLLSLFFEDEISLREDLSVSVGSKFEYNSFTGLEIQPSVRASYTPFEGHTWWGAVSRAVRTPSRMETDGALTMLTYPRVRVRLFGSESFDAEELLAYEFGYRWQVNPEAALDLTAYYHDYKRLRSFELGLPRPSTRPLPLHLVVPFHIRNKGAAEAYGLEAGVDWKPLPHLRSRLAYTYSVVHADVRARTFDPISATLDDDTPEQQVYVQLLWNPADNWEVDTTLRYVDPLPALGVSSYLTADLRLAYSPRSNLEISVVGQNLFEAGHLEFSDSFVNTLPTHVQRSVYGQVTWRFGK